MDEGDAQRGWDLSGGLGVVEAGGKSPHAHIEVSITHTHGQWQPEK